jgi:hypothetical protein
MHLVALPLPLEELSIWPVVLALSGNLVILEFALIERTVSES